METTSGHIDEVSGRHIQRRASKRCSEGSVAREQAGSPCCVRELVGDGTNSSATLSQVDSTEIVAVNDASSNECTHNLREDEDGYFAPGEVAPSGERDCDGGVDVSTGDTTGNPDTAGRGCS